MGATIISDINPRNRRTEGEEYLLSVFETSDRFNGWTVFEQPHINSIKPDFVIMHPQRGIVIIEVKDWNLNHDIYRKDGWILGTDGNLYHKNPINQVKNYKNCILKSDLVNSEEFIENNNKYYGCIETVVYFHGVTRARAEWFCGNSQFTKIWVDDDIKQLEGNDRLNAKQYTYALAMESSKYNKNGLLEKFVGELSCYLQYDDYNEERREPFKLTGEQNRLAKLRSNSVRRWGGVAGAGKSLILAEKAVRALKDGHRVLILTYNITLRHYLRDLCSQQYGTGEGRSKLRSDLTIAYYHEFLVALAGAYNVELSKSDDDNFTETWMEQLNTRINHDGVKDIFQYDYILVDEGQDFKGDWIRFMKRFFTQKGELLIVYDKAQDIYSHGLWIEDPDEIKNIGFRGDPGTLKVTYRLPNEIVEKIKGIRSVLNIDGEDILVPESNRQSSLLYKLKWLNSRSQLLNEKLIFVWKTIKELRATNSFEDITILTTNEKTGVEIVKFLTNTGIKVSHVYDIDGNADIEKRRNQKFKFNGGTGRLKVCTYHSYKGWQTPNVILVLDEPSTRYVNGRVQINENEEDSSVENSIFISISRVKKKKLTGEYSFTCINFIPRFDSLSSVFDDEIIF